MNEGSRPFVVQRVLVDLVHYDSSSGECWNAGLRYLNADADAGGAWTI